MERFGHRFRLERPVVGIWDIKIRENPDMLRKDDLGLPVDMHQGPLPRWRGSKQTNNGHLMHITGEEGAVANVERRMGSC